jgi:hypothetical protein
MSDADAANLMHNDVAPQLAEPVKPDPRGAMLSALTSGFAPLQKLGEVELEAQAKAGAKGAGTLTQKDILSLGGFDPKSRLTAALSGDVSALQPESEKPLVVNGQIVKMVPDGKYIPVADMRDQYEAPILVGGDRYQRQKDTGKIVKLDNAPQVKVSVGGPQVNVNAGQKAGMEAWAKSAVGTVEELGKSARSAVELVGTLNQMDTLAAGGTFNGVTATPATWVANLAQTAGLKVDESKLANSEAYTSVAREAVQKLVAQYGGNKGMTKEEAQELRTVIPQLSASPEARKRLGTILRAMAGRRVEDFNQANAQLGEALRAEDPAKFTFTGTLLPNAEPMAPALPVSGTGTGHRVYNPVTRKLEPAK